LVGKDLLNVPANQLQRLNKMLGEVPLGSETRPVPWHVWKASIEGLTRYIVFLGEQGSFLLPPLSSSARIQIFDDAGRSILPLSTLRLWIAT
jgi:hypothetical protein